MKSAVCIAVLLLLAGSASAQTRRASPSPSPSPSPKISPSPSPALDDAETVAAVEPVSDNATEPATTGPATTPTGPARPRAAGAAGATNLPDKRIKAMFDSPGAAAERIPELRELSKLISASPAVSRLLQDKNLVATIFAPNNAAVEGALEYVSTNFPNMTTADLSEMGIIDGLLQYHVTAGNAALTADRLRNNMKLTMLNQEPTTIIKRAAGGARHLLQEESIFIRSNTNQTVPVVDGPYQGGKAIIHVIDGVLIPASLAANYSMTDIPGASNETVEEPAAGADNETVLEPAANSTRAGAADTTEPAPSPAPKAKSSAAAAVASLLAMPTLLAVLML